ncbi:amidase [Mycobacterium tuberculosis '98-R604 INH-RIF-EM']|nr:amidase [Mycobacterium tuberculosis '98-R604 INH-RIF-EM']
MAMSAKASDDIAWLPATAQLAVLAAKKVSSAELVELYLSRIDTYNASLNAIVTVDPDAARRVAKRSDAARARGDELGPLHGLPITVKDSYETAGMRTTCGRRDLADYVPTQDAEAVARLRRAGAIIMGKTNMPTGNQDVQASNPVFGRTNNPWDAARTSGGSAGGGAAATAAGLTSFDYGSEIGGSTRIPAHYCGLYGHKSTWRSVPLVGHIPSAPGNPGRWGQADMACAGVQVRGARDIIPALEATVGPMRADGGFSYALAPPRAGALKDFRVAVWAEDPHCPIDADVRRAMDDAVAALRAAGAHVVEQPATIPVDMAVSHNDLPESGVRRLRCRPVHPQPSLRRRARITRGSASSGRSRQRPGCDATEPPCVVVRRCGAPRNARPVGRILQRVRRAAPARHAHPRAAPPQQGPRPVGPHHRRRRRLTIVLGPTQMERAGQH